jgi:hypothetical protein
MEGKVEQTPEWSTKEKELLHHDDFVAESAKRRAQSTNEHPKPWWQRFLESAGGTAFITVLFTGIFGQCITAQFQRAAKEREYQQAVDLKDREFEQAWIKARGDQALVAYKEYLDGEQEIVKRAYELIGYCISASDGLISITARSFNPYHGYVGNERKVMFEQLTSIKDRFNQTTLKWDNEREQLGLLMGYYHKGNQDITDSWKATQVSVSNYMDCARSWELDHPEANLSEKEIDNACSDAKKVLDDSLSSLTKSIDSGRKYAWEGWESPESLKSISRTKTK